MLFLLVVEFCVTLLLPYSVTSQSCKTFPDNRPGDCINIKQCPALNSILLEQQQGSQRGSYNRLNILRKSICATEGSNFRVCCTRTTTNKSKLPSQCGISLNNDRIVNGENAELGAWPWMVLFRATESSTVGGSCRNKISNCPGLAASGWCQRSVEYMNDNCKSSCNKCPSVKGSSNWICGGVLITDQYILTAAHCFRDTTHIEFVRIGEFDLSKPVDSKRGRTAPQPQDIKVESVIKHPGYGNPCRRCNDIALVKLIKPAKLYTGYVQTICLPSNLEQDMGFSASELQNRVAVAAGWGVTDAADIFATSTADVLQQVKLKIHDTSFCSKQKAKYPDRHMILCAGQGDGKDVCRADSGGPLMLRDGNGFKSYVVAITSFGATVCGDRSAQGIFTSVHHYTDWIHQNIV